VRVAALYDVHGNLPALEAVLADPRCAAADVVVCGGDLVAGPLPAECLAVLQGLGERARFVRGNGDRETVTPPDEGQLAEIGRWCAARLDTEALAAIAEWPLTVVLALDGLGEALFCHAVPEDDQRLLTAATPDADVARELAGCDRRIVVCGHTHVQFDRVVGSHRLVNAGSVGMPYEGSPDARWALLGPEVELVSTPYDADAALAQLAATGYPLVEDWFGPVVRGEISAEEATAVFEERRRGA
jgi:predicted phosphodiesterase